MSDRIGRLVVELYANIAKFESDWARAAQTAKRETAKIMRELDAMGKSGVAGAMRANTALAAAGQQAKYTAGQFLSLKRVAGELGGVLTVLSAYNFAKSVVEATNKLIGFENALVAVTGSQQAAAQEMAFVRKVAHDLGLDLETVMQRYVSMTAAWSKRADRVHL